MIFSLCQFLKKKFFDEGNKSDTRFSYRSKFKHNDEKASPGYYSVKLEDENIFVELTSTTRCGFHRYTFPKENEINLLINLEHGIQDRAIDTYFKIIDDYTIEGYRTSSGWAKKHTVYFYASFNKKIISSINNYDNKETESEKKKLLKTIISFEIDDSKNLTAKVGISHTSIAGAKLNLQREIGEMQFDEIRIQADSIWENELSEIKVHSNEKSKKEIFYTSLYHSFLTPNILNDVDGSYIGMDSKIHVANDFNMYTVFSLWDTFRALHPLIYLLDKNRAKDFVLSLLEKSKQNNILPVWELSSNETGTMIGYHSVPVIAEAIMKNINGFDYEDAYSAMVKSAMQDTLGINFVKDFGFIPMDKEDDAVSRTLEYAYDDWCISQVAKKLNKQIDYDYFIQRAMNYKNVFDRNSGFMRGRYFDGRWKTKFDPSEPFPLGAGEFTEGSSWQYSWFVPQDISGLISLIGGDDKFLNKLNEFFNSTANGNYYVPADVTGLIGQYAHGNEPSHHISYLYNFIEQPEKTQRLVRKILNEMYTNKNDGLIGNEDCGQMSAWYVFSSLGFYPVNPVSNTYILGSGIFDSAEVTLANGKVIKIKYQNNSEKNIFINKARIDGKPSMKSYLTYEEIINAKEILFEHSSTYTGSFGKGKINKPVSSINLNFIPSEKKVLFPPFINTLQTVFTDSLEIKVGCITDGASIIFSFGDLNNENGFSNYEKPIVLKQSGQLNFRSIKEQRMSEITSVTFEKGFIPTNSGFPKIILQSEYSDKYRGTGKNNLLDGIRASENFRDGFWQGFYGKDFEAIIDLGSQKLIRELKVGFLSNQGSWIFLPRNIQVFSSDDGINYSLCSSQEIGEPKQNYNIFKNDFLLEINNNTRFIKIIARSIGKCPDWHNGKGYDSWLFLDEIILKPTN